MREPEFLGQTVVVIGGSSGIGLETARRAGAEGARVVLTGRNPERLQHAASELEALSSAAFDATDPFAWFQNVLTRIGQCSMQQLDELLPHPGTQARL